MSQFLNVHKFSVELSFDGLIQDIQRKKGSFQKTVSIIKKLLNFPDIDLEVNSVFTPKTVESISESIKFIIDLGVPNINYSLSYIESWNQESLLKLKKELTKLRKLVLSHYRKNADIPVVNYREDHGRGIFYCAAGKDRLAISPEGKVWGCFLFPDYFKGKERTAEYKKFCFGTLANLIKNFDKIYPRKYSNYAQLSMDNFSTSRMNCFLCSELESCAVCPVNAAFTGLPLGKIPSYVCEIQKIKIRNSKKFRMDMC